MENIRDLEKFFRKQLKNSMLKEKRLRYKMFKLKEKRHVIIENLIKCRKMLGFEGNVEEFILDFD